MYIKSLLDSDLYKFTMMLFARYKFPNTYVEYAFKCRSKVKIDHLATMVNKELDEVCQLHITGEELEYLIKNIDIRFDHPDFNGFKLDRTSVTVTANEVTGELDIRVKGIWWKVILFEIYVLSIVNEAYTESLHDGEKIEQIKAYGRKILNQKIDFLNEDRCAGIKIMEFGTRRRFTREWQEEVLETLLNKTTNIIGTSNVYLAKKLGIKPMGTMAHEAFQVMQGIVHPIKSQVALLRDWKEFWGNKYLVALTDIFPNAKFIKDFAEDLAKDYLGLRHDSGDPLEWGDLMIEKYNYYKINTTEKSLTFSDGLDVYDTLPIYDRFSVVIGVFFGMGTKLTNDLGEMHNALQIVMKIVKVDGQDVAKLSNTPGKIMCENQKYTEWLIEAINQDINNEY